MTDEPDLIAARSAELSRQQLELALMGLRSLPGISVVIYDRDLRYVFCDGGAVVQAGYVPAQLEGRLLSDMLPAERWQRYEAKFRAALDGESSTLESLGPDGERWHAIEVVPWRDAQGAVVGGMVIGREITEQRRQRDDVAYLASLIDASDDAIIGKDLHGVITSWNPGAERMYGYIAEEIVGRHISLLTLPGHDDEIDTLMSRVAAGEVVHERVRRRRRDQTVLMVDVTISPIRDADGVITGAATVARDISGAVAVEDDLRRSEQRWRAIFASPRLGVCVRDPGGILIECNARYAAIFATTPEALVGTGIDAIMAPDDAAFAQRVYDGRWTQSELEPNVPRPTTTADGRELMLWTSAYPIRNADGSPAHQLILIDDKTETARLESELAQSRRIESIGRLAGGVAHELNNGLAIILGFNDRAGKRLEAADAAQADLAEVRIAAERSAELARSLLAFGRRQALAPQPLVAAQVVAALAGVLRPTLGVDVQLAIRDESDVARVMADRAQLEQVIVNLALNGQEAMPGGGRLTITTAREPTRGDEPGAVTITVQDTGRGIAPELRERIFEPFFTTKPFVAGSGLGLSTALGIVEQSGGTIRVHSRPGAGTRMMVVLPELTGEETPGASPSPPGLSILLVEDEEAVRQLMALMLEEAGHRVTATPGGARAARLFGEAPDTFDVLLTDLILGDMHGGELARQLLVLAPDLGVVYVSGYPGEAVMREGMPPGDALLAKPFTEEQLLDAVTTVAARRT